ncbi:MAG: lipopolysaccharide core heptose(I) kinase RfaP [Gammaproteobacteria bacterium]
MHYLREDLKKLWPHKNVFPIVQKLQGDIYRHKEGRRTLRFDLNDKSYFLKLHEGVGWGEIIKNLIQLRRPVISAKNEWRAIKFLQQQQIQTMSIAAYGEQGINPAKKLSFLVTDDLTDTMSLEHLGKQWQERSPTFTSKNILIKKLASIAKKMHENGLNHRDFYLCHFLLDQSFSDHNIIEEKTLLFLIDLHRAEIRKKTPERWIIKDLGSLYFSAMEVPLTQRDIFRFMKTYTGLNLRTIFNDQKDFWIKTLQRAEKLRDQ